MKRYSAAMLIALFVLTIAPLNGQAKTSRPVRIGYLDHPGASLVVLAEVAGLYKSNGLEAALVPFGDGAQVLAALETGHLAFGAVPVEQTLGRIGAGGGLNIIAGGGRLEHDDMVGELDEEDGGEPNSGIVIVAATGPGALDKEIQVRLVTALIQAYQCLKKDPLKAWRQIVELVPDADQRHPHLDPDPDFWRLKRLWTALGLQKEGMKRDFLSSHVNEEIYCDALDDLLDADGRKDPVLLKLNSRAVCVPDCCPTKRKKQQ
ncbi:hypothetical protein [Geotalea sp. SG265]|uniref:hypothetical protein n=1 Tax=Geotalea sp. SG265 TaxID=2922867 RepID=UPI001FAE9D65|nr:hypothetical protein [Geotalea sp. SG265]